MCFFVERVSQVCQIHCIQQGNVDGQPPSEVGAVECNFLKVIDQLFVHRINTLSPLRQRSLRFIMMQAVSQETGKGCRRHRPPVLPSEIGSRQKARTVRKVQENRSFSQKGTRNSLRDIVHSNSGSCGFPNSPMRMGYGKFRAIVLWRTSGRLPLAEQVSCTNSMRLEWATH